MQPDSVSAVLLSVGSVGQVESVAEAVNSRFPKLETMSQKEMAPNMDHMLTGMYTFFDGINFVAMLVALVVVLVVMVMAVSERTKEIGTLRAIGAQETDGPGADHSGIISSFSDRRPAGNTAVLFNEYFTL